MVRPKHTDVHSIMAILGSDFL